MGLHLLEVMRYLHKQNKSDQVSVGRMDISLHGGKDGKRPKHTSK